MKLVSIDVGLKNLSICVYQDKVLVQFGIYNLLEYVPKKYKTDYSYMVYHFIKKRGEIFNKIDVLLIENQMSAKFKVIQHSFRCFFFEKAVKVSPLAVRKFFKISCSDYRKNKKASIQFVQQFLSSKQMEQFKQSKKKDDIADCIIIAQYYLQKFIYI